MSRKKTAVSVGDLLPKVLRKMEADPRPSREEMDEVWQRAAGKEAARSSWPRRLVRGRLIVEVENSGWMYTLHRQKTELLQKLIELLGQTRIQSLSFRIGERKDG